MWEETEINIPGVDTEAALALYDDDLDIYLPVLRSFSPNASDVIEKINTVSPETLANYAILVHGLKSISANIGAKKIIEAASDLEMKAKAGDLDGVLAGNAALIKEAKLVVAGVQAWLDKHDQHQRPHETKKEHSADKHTLLIVDDNETNLTVCREILSSRYVVYPVLSAQKMLELLKRIKPDMILLDVEMPEIDGYEAIRLLKDNNDYCEIPVIFLSAREDAESEKMGLTLGAVDFVQKPFSSAQLLERVERHLTRH